MASVFCNKCSEEIEIPEGRRSPFITCPKCRAAVPISNMGSSAPSRPAAPRAPAPPPARPAAAPMGAAPAAPPMGSMPSAPPPMQSPNGMDSLPELMKANKKVAGQPCAICARPINLGEQIHNCPNCHSINHDACWRQSGGCTSISCRSPQAAARPQVPAAASAVYEPPPQAHGAGAPGGNMVPCRWCKEPIMRGARKCKHCNEFQRDEDRETNNKVTQDEEDLSVTDWIGVLCCPLIAFIQGIIYASQGRSKGKRLMLYAAIAMFLGALVKAGGN